MNKEKPETAPRTLEELLADMNRGGREFGARVRGEQGKRAMPEPVFEGKRKEDDLPEYYRISLVESFRIQVMRQLGLVHDTGYLLTWSEFFGRVQEEVNTRRPRRYVFCPVCMPSEEEAKEALRTDTGKEVQTVEKRFCDMVLAERFEWQGRTYGVCFLGSRKVGYLLSHGEHRISGEMLMLAPHMLVQAWTEWCAVWSKEDVPHE